MPIDTADLPALTRIEQLADRVGIELVSLSHDEVVGTMPVAGNRQPFGLLHGRASAVLSATPGSTLAARHALPDRFPVGLDLARTHRRSARSGLVTRVARPLHVEGSTSKIVVSDEEGRRACPAKLTCLHRDSRPEGW